MEEEEYTGSLVVGIGEGADSKSCLDALSTTEALQPLLRSTVVRRIVSEPLISPVQLGCAQPSNGHSRVEQKGMI